MCTPSSSENMIYIYAQDLGHNIKVAAIWILLNGLFSFSNFT